MVSPQEAAPSSDGYTSRPEKDLRCQRARSAKPDPRTLCGTRCPGTSSVPRAPSEEVAHRHAQPGSVRRERQPEGLDLTPPQRGADRGVLDLIEGRGQTLCQPGVAKPPRHLDRRRQILPHKAKPARGVARVEDPEIKVVFELVGEADQQYIPLERGHRVELRADSRDGGPGPPERGVAGHEVLDLRPDR